MDDLFQIGCIGLIKAIDNFDLSHEVRFSTYAVPMIIGEIKRYLRDNQMIPGLAASEGSGVQGAEGKGSVHPRESA